MTSTQQPDDDDTDTALAESDPRAENNDGEDDETEAPDLSWSPPAD